MARRGSPGIALGFIIVASGTGAIAEAQTVARSVAAVAPPVVESPVADAAMLGDRAAVAALLKKGEDVNAPQGDGMTALHWAAVNGDAELTRTLLRARAEVLAVTRNGGYTPLHLASRGGHVAIVTALLQAGSDTRARTSSGDVTPLHFAAGAGDAAAVAALIESGADVNARESERGQTPLIFAVATNRLDAVKALLARGADPALATTVLDLPAMEAVDRQAEERRNQVLESFNTSTDSTAPPPRPTPDQVQAAVRAAHEIQRSVADAKPVEREESFLGSDEVPNFSGLVGSMGGLTALLYAAREGHSEIALALLGAGADINRVSDGDHTSPLLMAAINGHFDLALQLLERGADPNLQSDAGSTPLYAVLNTQWAPRSRYPQQHAWMLQKATYLDAMKALLDAGADPDVRLKKHLWYMSFTFDLLGVDTRGATPFWRAAYATDVEAMKLLVSYGADPDIPTIRPPERRRRARPGATPREDPSGLPPVPADGPGVYAIHAASGVGYGEGYAGNAHRHVPDGWLPAVRYLIEELGADVNARDYNGYNAVHHAAARGDNTLIEYLVTKGADVTAVSRRGQTTADMANGPVQRISPFPGTVALLEKLGSKNNHRCLSC
ncbi:MAG: ankyrin repeat domain-containing protein [Gemmatimonadetes bacterium]|nr:ankyrin repeat domain-containing protein [Gemmatimonadota bacterium]